MLLVFPSLTKADIETGYFAMQRGEYDIALEELEPLAEKGDAQAQYYLGYMHEKGLGVQLNYSLAWKWYRLAAKKKHIESMLKMAWLNENGIGLPLNYDKAYEWYEKAAEKGHAGAMGRLGLYNYDGMGVYTDVNKALKWYKKAAEAGDPKSIAALDELDRKGIASLEIKGETNPEDEKARKILGDFIAAIKPLTITNNRGAVINLTDSPKISKHEDSYRIYLPKVEILGEQNVLVRVGTVRFDITPANDTEYFVKVLIPGKIRAVNLEGDVYGILAVDSQKFETKWSVPLNNATMIDLAYKDINIDGIMFPFSMKIEQIELPMKMKDIGGGLFDFSSTMKIKGITAADNSANIKDGKHKLSISSIELESTTDGLNLLAHKKFVEDVNKAVASVFLQQKKAQPKVKPNMQRVMAKIKFPEIPVIMQSTKGAGKILGLKIRTDGKKEDVSIKEIKFETGGTSLDKPLSTMFVDFNVDGISVAETAKTKTALFFADEKKDVPETLKAPEKISFRLELDNLPLLKIADHILKKTPELLAPSMPVIKKIPSSGDVLAPSENMGGSAFAILRLMEELKIMAVEADATLHVKKLIANAVDYDIDGKGKFQLARKGMGVSGKLKLAIRGLDALTVKKGETTTDAINEKMPKDYESSILDPLLAFRDSAEKSEDEQGRQIETFAFSISPDAGVEINGKPFLPANMMNQSPSGITGFPGAPFPIPPMVQ